MTTTSSFKSTVAALGVSLAVSLRTCVLLMSCSLGLDASRSTTPRASQQSHAVEAIALWCRRPTSASRADRNQRVDRHHGAMETKVRVCCNPIEYSPEPFMSGNPDLAGQTVVVIGGSSGIGLETARRARAEGAQVILTARDPDRLQRVGLELGARIAAFDATDFERLGRFFDDLPTPIDHVLVTGPGPYYAPLAEFDVEKARRDVDAHPLLPLQVARPAASQVRPGR